MRLTQDAAPGLMLIDRYDSGELQVSGRLYREPCLVAAHSVLAGWGPVTAAALGIEHLERLLEFKPDVVLVGASVQRGSSSAKLRAALCEHRIGLEWMELGAACRTYNVLVQEDRAVIALLFPV